MLDKVTKNPRPISTMNCSQMRRTVSSVKNISSYLASISRGGQVTQRRRYGKTSNVAIIGAPFSGGQPKDGVRHFPSQFRDLGFRQRIESLHQRKVMDYGDIEVPEYCTQQPTRTTVQGYEVNNVHACGLASKRVASLVQQASCDGAMCVMLGGDHSVATGSIFGHCQSRNDISVIWVDAHNDMNTPDTSPSGNLHGMALSFLIKGSGEWMSTIPGYEWVSPFLDPKDVVFIGSRDTDVEEYKTIMDLGIPMFSMQDIDKYGIAYVIEEAVKMLSPNLDRPIHISYDVDALDPVHVPGTGTKVFGGLTLREGMFIGEYVSRLGLLAGVDLVEVNTNLCKGEDEVETTLNSTMALLHACLGWQRPGYQACHLDIAFIDQVGKPVKQVLSGAS